MHAGIIEKAAGILERAALHIEHLELKAALERDANLLRTDPGRIRLGEEGFNLRAETLLACALRGYNKRTKASAFELSMAAFAYFEAAIEISEYRKRGTVDAEG